jgi:hypothetical protein
MIIIIIIIITIIIIINSVSIILFVAVPWLRRSVVGIFSQRHMFDPRPVHVRVAVEEMALERGFLPDYFVFVLSL